MVASSKCSLSICRTRSRTISLNPYQSGSLSVLMLQHAVTIYPRRKTIQAIEAANVDEPEGAKEVAWKTPEGPSL